MVEISRAFFDNLEAELSVREIHIHMESYWYDGPNTTMTAYTNHQIGKNVSKRYYAYQLKDGKTLIDLFLELYEDVQNDYYICVEDEGSN